jgi:hypothetical protein
MALGALIIKEKLNITDEETVELIRENPYLQYLIGLQEYRDEAPFDPSMMVHFRKRITPEILSRINETIVQRRMSKYREDDEPPGSTEEDGSSGGGGEEEGAGNSGIMMIDASVAPADIAYPTDLNLLNESREKLEGIIDVLYEPVKGTIDKPRTYRQKARKSYLVASKRRRISQKALRKALKQQLQYIHLTTLGRPPKDKRKDVRQEREDSSMRNAIEGGFGTAKRRYGMNRIMARLQETSETSISLVILVMNLEKILKCIFVRIVYWLTQPMKLVNGL